MGDHHMLSRASFLLLALAGTRTAQQLPMGIAIPTTYSLNYDPTLSPDGKRMIFLKLLEGREQMFVANPDGTDERQLSRDSVDLEDPAWSPDGKQVAYVRLAGQRNSPHVMT